MPAFPDMGILPLGAKTSPSLPAMPPECPAGLSQCLAAFISPVSYLFLLGDGQEAEAPSAWAHPPCAFPGHVHEGLPDGMKLRG